MTDESGTDAENAARVEALSRFARATATAFQGALQFATQAEQSLVDSLTALVDEGQTLDQVAAHVGLRREYVEQLLDGQRMSLRFL